MRFRDRSHAATLLATSLAAYRGSHPLVLGLPRGGVPMARVVAEALDGDLDVVLVRKLRAPGQPELAIGAVDESGVVVQGPYFGMASDEYVREEVRGQREMLLARRARYAQAHEGLDPTGRTVIIVDDGIATGASMIAAVECIRRRGAKAIVVAVGVAPLDSVHEIQGLADEVVCLYVPETFRAVGQFFEDFSEVTDDDVVAALAALPDTHHT